VFKEICKFRDNSYRVAQEDGSGGPFVQFNHPEEGWVRANLAPRTHFLALEAELAVALGEVRRYRKLAKLREVEVLGQKARILALSESFEAIQRRLSVILEDSVDA